MPEPYPQALRERVLTAHDGGMSQRDVAEEFGISRTTLVMWVRLRRETGAIEPRPHGGGATAKVSLPVLERVLRELPDGTRDELTALYNRVVPRSERAHVSSVYRALRRNGYVVKKNGRGRWSKSDRT